MKFVIKSAIELGLSVRALVFLLSLSVLSTFFEGLGIGLLLPVFQYLISQGDLAALTAQSAVWEKIVRAFALIHLPVNLATLLIASTLCIAARQTFSYLRLVSQSRTLFGLTRDIRVEAFRRHLEVDLGFAESRGLGDFVNDFITESERAAVCIAKVVGQLSNSLLGGVYVTILLVVSPMMTVVALGGLVAAVLPLRRLVRDTQSQGREVTSANRDLNIALIERLRSLRLLRLSGVEAAELGVLSDLATRQYLSQAGLERMKAGLAVLVEPVVVVVAFVFLFVAVEVAALPLAEIGLFLVVLLRMLPIVKDLTAGHQAVLGNMAAISSVQDGLRAMAAAREARNAGGAPLTALTDGIRYDGVVFRYSEASKPALNQLDLFIPAGKLTALVGPSGSGKSTLVDLLPRLRLPQEGQVSIDGTALADFDLAALRHQIAYVSQSPQMLNLSISDHIRLGNPGATEADIRRAATLSGVAEFVERLPKGYDTLVGEGAVALSGGQRQRLDIARALVSHSLVLVLDEPTSNLDADAEEMFLDTVRHLRKDTGMTIILIGHRLSTCSLADQIAVISGGRVQEVGRHDELLASGGWYAKSFAKQHTLSVR